VKKKVLWICPESTPYHEVLFDALASDPMIELKVVYITASTSTHPFGKVDKRKYAYEVSNKANRIDWNVIFKTVKEENAACVISSYLYPTLKAAIVVMGIMGRKFAYYTDTPLPNEVKWCEDGFARRSFIARTIRGLWLKQLFKWASKVLVTGEPGVNAVIRLGCDPKKAINFPYWVSVNVGGLPIIARKISLLAVGQLIYRKGYEYAIRAFSEVIKEKRFSRARFVIIGSGNYEKELKKMSRKMKIPVGNIVFKGWMENEMIKKEMLKSSVFVHPAIWEPYGVVIIEAMAHGMPILASNCTIAAVDRVRDGVSGILNKVGDVKQLEMHMKQLLANRMRARKMGSEARRVALTWNPKIAVKMIKEIFSIAGECNE